jgi:hypothetical protein
MPTIKLTNNTTLTITASSADENATLNHYLKNPLVFLAPAGFETIAGKKVGDLDPAVFPLTAAVTGGGRFAVKEASLDVQLNASASLGLLTGADKDDFFSSLQISGNSPVAGLVSFGFQGTLSAGPMGVASDFGFGITNGTTLTLTNFCTAAGADTFGETVQRAITGLTIPRDIDDLKTLPANAICEIEASSSLQFTASVTYSFLNAPLATASISELPSIAIKTTAGATLEATATHTADHTVTIAKLPNGRLHLAVSLAKIDDFETSLTVSAGLAAKVGSQDALAFLLDKISPNGTAETAKIAADMPAEKVQQMSCDIKAAIDAALNSSLGASLKAALDDSKVENRLFLYEIDLTALDGDSAGALQSALAGDFTKISRPAAVLAGIRELDSALTVTSRLERSLTLHLLGIFNWESTNTFIEKSKVAYTKDTHEIVLSDETIKIATNNLDAEKLREVVLKGVTLTLPASANTPAAKTPIKLVFFERKAATRSSTMRQFVNVLQATGTPSAAGASSLLNQNLQNYGTSSLYLSLNLTPPQCRQLFIDRNGNAYDWTYYLRHACSAASTILDGDGDSVSASRLKLFRAEESFWEELKEAGAPANQVRLLASRGIGQSADVDVITFIWWSSAMENYAKALAASQSLVGIGKQVVKDGTRGFNEPWLILATWEMLQNPAINVVFTSSMLKLAAGFAH